MKLIFSLFIIALLAFGTYQLTFALSNKKKGKGNKKLALSIATLVCVLLLGGLANILYQDTKAPDLQCGKVHPATTQTLASPVTAMDYYNQGNYDYETGNCEKAISNYKGYCFRWYSTSNQRLWPSIFSKT
jgi:heme A synthase